MAERVGKLWDQLRRQGWGHWITVLVLAVVGLYAGRWLGEEQFWIGTRYRVYQTLQGLAPRPPFPKTTMVVLIGDEEYWKGDLARRTPIRRDYLAVLVRQLAAANAAVIALDFDLRSPLPDGSLVEHAAYAKETAALAEAIQAASRTTKIVLPAAVAFDADRAYILDSDIFAGHQFDPKRVRHGYIALPYDLRKAPLEVELKDKRKVDSFSQAIVRSHNEAVLDRLPKYESLPYASYISRAEFLAAKAVVPAGDVVHGKVDPQRLAHKVVLVGGGWRRYAYNRGPEIDTYPTPVGTVPGVFIHANYVEALLDSRTYHAIGGTIEHGLEIAAVVVIALLFALDLKTRTKLAWVVGVLGFLLLLSYFFWQNLGRFFDFFIPIILLSGHFAIEQIQHWRHKAAQYDDLMARNGQKGE